MQTQTYKLKEQTDSESDRQKTDGQKTDKESNGWVDRQKFERRMDG